MAFKDVGKLGDWFQQEHSKAMEEVYESHVDMDIFMNGPYVLKEEDYEDPRAIEVAVRNLLSLAHGMREFVISADDEKISNVDDKELYSRLCMWDFWVYTALSDAFAALGIRKLKLGERLRNALNTAPKTKRMYQKMNLIEKLLKNNNWQVDKGLITDAMKATDLGERRVQDLIKKVKEETKRK